MEEWSRIVSVIFAVVMAISLSLAFRRRKKGEGAKKAEELHGHLRDIGVEVSLAEEGDDRQKIGLARASGQKSEGLIELEDRNVDAINVVSVASQYGIRYFIDYLVKGSNMMGERVFKKTQLTRKKSPPLWGKVVAVEWKGDDSLAQSLNLDYSLEQRLLEVDLNAFKENIWILPEPKYGYARIRTDYWLPSAAIFEAIDMVARHIKSW
jgi:hypothetical protein